MKTEGNIIKLKVMGMSCGGCVNAVKSALESIDGVIEATVDLESGSADVKIGGNGIDSQQIKTAVSTAGYGVEIIG